MNEWSHPAFLSEDELLFHRMASFHEHRVRRIVEGRVH